MLFAHVYADIDECADNNCTNGATCVDGVNGYTCTCTSGYNDTYCETGKWLCQGKFYAHEMTQMDIRQVNV